MAYARISRKIANDRLLTVLFLGFSSGLPLALTGATLQAWFTQAHVSLLTIGFLSLLGLPYTLKFLWAPLMDYFHLAKWGKRKGWILLTQLGVAFSLFILAQMDPTAGVVQMGWMALGIAFFSASQDIAVDAYRTEILQTEERGLGAAYFVFAYRIALLISGGLALVCADYVGWKRTYECMACLILLSMIPVYRAPSITEIPFRTARSLFEAMRYSLQDLLQRDQIVTLILFVIFYKIGDALALSLMTNFLLHGLGFSLTQVGLAFKIVSFVATVLGGLVGGMILLKWSLYRALLLFGLAQTFSNLMFVILAMVGKHFLFMTLAISIENFCSGLSTAAFLAFLMSLCHRPYTAGQYALLSAVASLGRVFLGPVAAVMVQNLGWVQFYLWSFVLCFPGLILLLLLKERVHHYASIMAD